MAQVTVWAWQTTFGDHCYQIGAGGVVVEVDRHGVFEQRPFVHAERMVLAGRVASLIDRIERSGPPLGVNRPCTHMFTKLYDRPWRNWFRKREFKVCVLCDLEVGRD